MKGRWTFLAAFAFVFYGNGAAFVESFVNYSSWHLIGSDEFTQFHRFIGPRVLAFLVAPALIGTLLTILVLRLRPPAVPAWAVWAAIVLQVKYEQQNETAGQPGEGDRQPPRLACP